MKAFRGKEKDGFARQVDEDEMEFESIPMDHQSDAVAGGPSSTVLQKQMPLPGPESNIGLMGNSSSHGANDSMFFEPAPSTMLYRQNSRGDVGPGHRGRPTLHDLDSPFFKAPVPEEEPDKAPSNILRTTRTDSLASNGPTLQRRMSRTRQLAVKYGWIQGVLVRCLLNIWGVILFIRLSWVVGQAGILLATCVILLSVAVTTITALSMSAICTNGEVKGGGAYYLISRSLGPEFGGAIGLIFSFANAVGMSMYVVGFAETVWEVMDAHGARITGQAGDIRIISVLTITCLLGLAVLGGGWESKVQVGLLTILISSILAFFLGALIGPRTDAQIAKGFTGFALRNLENNWAPSFHGETFLSVFAIFFPAATGILAGANMSGDLKDPSKAIPKGTLIAIFITTAVYLLMAWTCGLVMLRHVVDQEATAANNGTTVYRNDAGLLYDYSITSLVSVWAPLVLAGIFSATLSSALVSLLSAPRIFQAVCKDKLFPYTGFFAKGSGPSDDPKRGYFLAYGIGIVIVLIGWRPSFRYYSAWVALVGALLCVCIMFLTNWWGALITFLLVLVIYKYIEWSKPDVNWGSSTQAKTYITAMQAMLRLDKTVDHVKTFRPQLLVMSGPLGQRGDMVRFGGYVCKNVGMVMAANVLVGEFDKLARHANSARSNMMQGLDKNLEKVKLFAEVIVAPSIRQGLQNLGLIGGLGKMRPNTIMFGFKYNWQNNREEVEDYVGMIGDAFEMQCGVMVVRGNHDSESGKTDLPFYQLKPTTTIDVWWLVDDGGMTLLFPYLISTHKYWSKCKLRVLTQASDGEITDEEMRMTRLLLKFRIQADVVVIDSMDQAPSAETVDQFRQLNVMQPDQEISERTKRQLRLRELLLEHSSQASLIVVSLPFPRKNDDKFLYMGWLESLTAGLPPTVLIRGNQQSVLTFYS